MSRFIRPASLRLLNEETERHATWLEIFFDLIFAVIVTQISDRLFNHLNYFGVLQCMALFIPVMWTWASYTVFAARFDNDDGIHWFMTFVIMFAGVIMAIQIPFALEKGDFGFTIGFLIGQISLLLLYIRVISDRLTPKNLIFLYVIGFGLGGIFWITSLFFSPPIKFYLWILGMSIYLCIPWIGRKKILSKAPLDTIYFPERLGAFTIIILGQTIASVVFGLESTSLDLSSMMTSIMAFILAILIWGQYYRFTQIADYKCTLQSGQPYIYTHIPLIMGLIIMGVCTRDFITAPLQVHGKVHIVFCFAAILYLTSFYFLQYIATRKFKIRAISYVCGIIAILFLFIFHQFPPLLTISGLVMIFTVLFGIQYWTSAKTSKVQKY